MLVSVVRCDFSPASSYRAHGFAWVHLTVDTRYDFFHVLGRWSDPVG